jgi:cytochrome c553
MHRLMIVTLAFATVASLGCIRPDGAKKTLAGQELYAACASCHGETGNGNASLAAPNIAGLPAWYVESQLVKYRSGIRGYHPEDHEGLRMRPMSRQMMNEAEVKAVSAYVATLAPVKASVSVQGGDATAGAGQYAVCQACHGDKGQGLEATKGPPLAGQFDWYLVNQLKKFKGGIRGAHPLDTTGAQMRPMATMLADEQAMKNVVAHISTFSR